ncbi:WD40 repeat-like protein [Rhodofomes roseus]|uniref:WD40 repeat-like protein n=1 Tax=Rhodofomes roseus TaxID=34475 RepID=A0ABQ8KXD3_9APHY|nr:WD40 repeat-like protein [Rhodofomes roseus]KAH9843963.1 WD40 repeat-like protein [Rhodofomes roseus]
MRTKHTPHSLPAFPVYSSAFVSENELVLGGGGGQSKTGIKNKLRLYRIDSDKHIELLHELELEKGEDAPMSMAAHPLERFIACGVNSSAEALQGGANQNCRLFAVEDKRLALSKTQSTLTVNELEDDFQKVTVFSPSGNLLAAAGTKDLSLLQYPSLSPVASPIHLDKGEIYDATFSSTTLVVATTISLLVYALPPSEGKSEKAAGKEKANALPALELLETVERPTLPGDNAGSSFRSVRYHPQDEKVLYTLVNAVPPRTRTKSSPRRAFVCRWNTEKWEVTKLRKVGDKGVTCFDVSPNGQLVAFGSSDYTVGILDAKTLAPLVTILKAHDFPPTTLRFNTMSNLLVSGSADNSIRVVTVPENLGATSWTFWVVIVTLLILLFAFIAQRMHEGL